jgi:Zn-dependent peptidase ImmA (M78 family)
MTWSPWAELRRHPDIWVHRCRLAEGLGWWCPDERMILVDDRLDDRATRCVVAHELAHAVLGHRGCPEFGDDEWFARRLEGEADRWAARRLVPLDDLAEVLAVHPDDEEAAAGQLGVTVDVLRTRLAALDADEREHLARRGAAREPAA